MWKKLFSPQISNFPSSVLGAAIKMDHFQPAVDPRKQELLEARFLGARVSFLSSILSSSHSPFPVLNIFLSSQEILESHFDNLKQKKNYFFI